MSRLLLYFILLCFIITKGQTKKLIVVIDNTICCEKENSGAGSLFFKKNPREVEGVVYSKWVYDKRFDSGILDYYPIDLENDSSTLRIQLDNQDSYVELSNLYKIKGDTLHIDSLNLYSHCDLDTLLTIKKYYTSEDKKQYFITYKLPAPVRTEFTNTPFVRKCKKKFPSTITLKINNQYYTTPVRIMEYPSKYSKEYFDPRKETLTFFKSKEGLYFTKYNVMKNYIYVAEIKLKG